MDGTQEFGARLRAHRCAVGLSQQELADKSGLTVKTIGNLERGRARWPHPSSVTRLADALGLAGPERDEFTAAIGRRLAQPDPQPVTPPRQQPAPPAREPTPGREPAPSGSEPTPATELETANDPAAATRQEAATQPETTTQPETAAHPEAAGYRHGLPPDTAGFTGRDAELELITGTARDGAADEPGGVVALRAIGGMPGVGKTALAVRAAHLLADAFPDRQLFVDLHGHTPGREPVSPEDALAGLLAAVGVDPRFLPADLAGRAMLWRDKMSGQRALLVLDNAASSAQLAPLLPGSGTCLVLVTSRRHLADLPGAVVPVPVDTLTPEHARAMFIRLTPRAADEDPAPIDELAELAGHLPLAVSLLARVHARHRSWTLAELIAETRGSLLTMTAEHASVAAAFDVSWRHLGPGPQGFLARLGLHPGGSIDRHAAAALADVPVDVAALLLGELHREGLLTETGFHRYRMHDLIRSYAAAQAEVAMTTGERDRALGRLLDYYIRAAARTDVLLAHRVRSTRAAEPAAGDPAAGDPPVPDPPVPDAPVPDLADTDSAVAWARAERPSLLACLDHATAAGWQPRVIALTAALAGLLERDGPWSEAITRHVTAVSAALGLGDRPGLARAMLDLGTARRLAGDFEDAAEVLEEAIGIHHDLADRSGLAAVLLELGHVYSLTDDYPAAAGSAERALRIYREMGDELGQGRTLILLGSVRRRTDDFEGAASALTQALDICRAFGDRAGQANALRQLGDVMRLAGDHHAAAACLEEALGLAHGLDDRLGEANALTWLGGVRRLIGDYQAAAAHLEQALDVQRELDNRLGEANALTLLGDLRRETGELQAAGGDLDRALRIYRDLGLPAGQAQVLCALGILRRLTGDYSAAAEHLDEAIGLSSEMGDRGGEATGLNNLGELYRVRGDVDGADDCHQQALALARQIHSQWDEAHALAGLGRCARAAGDIPAASRLLGQAHRTFRQIGSAEAAGLADELRAISENDLPS